MKSKSDFNYVRKLKKKKIIIFIYYNKSYRFSYVPIVWSFIENWFSLSSAERLIISKMIIIKASTSRYTKTYLLQWLGATGQLLLVLRIITGLALPTTGAEVRPWFLLLPQRWPWAPGLVPWTPGCGPLSLQALREKSSRFLSSHFIISSPVFSLMHHFLNLFIYV